MTQHITVMQSELIRAIAPKESGVYVDATLGGGGHLFLLLSQLSAVTVYAYDLNKEAIARVRHDLLSKGYLDLSDGFLVKQGHRIKLINANFSSLTNLEARLDGIYADLGFSTDQLFETPGLSYEQSSQPLDMRLGMTGKDVATLITQSSTEDLIALLMDYGDVKPNIAKELAVVIKQSLPQTVSELNRALQPVLNRYGRERSLLARIYQALRIAVNNEYGSLRQLVFSAAKKLKPTARFAVITFHSGEERVLVNTASKDFEQLGEVQRPSVIELRKNIRARSAKLYTFKLK